MKNKKVVLMLHQYFRLRRNLFRSFNIFQGENIVKKDTLRKFVKSLKFYLRKNSIEKHIVSNFNAGYLNGNAKIP
jgi:hypothetical protein